MKRFGILYHPMVEATQAKARELQAFLTAKGVSAWLCSAWDTEKARAQVNGTSLILTVGGDGTILRAAQVAFASGTPIAGVNLGRIGFMTEFSRDDVQEQLPRLLAGEGRIDERAMLEVELTSPGQKPQVFHALNEVLVARGAIPRMIHVKASINGQPLTSYRVDGVMVATATGSTGYSLASGGPVLYPQSKDMLLVPVVPHLSLRYPIVLPGTAIVRLEFSAVHAGALSIDGHINIPMSSGDVATIKPSRYTTRFLRIGPESSFYSSLEGRLKGK